MMASPAPLPLDPELLSALARRHGLACLQSFAQPWRGATSHVYPWGDVVIKIPNNEPDAITSLYIDTAIGPLARARGVKTPEVVAFDDSLTILPVPFAIIQRIQQSRPLEGRGVQSRRSQAAWRAVGREVARVHHVKYGSTLPVKLREFRQSPDVDPRPWVDALAGRGALETGDASWLLDMLDTLASRACVEIPLALCHGDINASNVLVSTRTGIFMSLIDWAGAGWLDPVWDFSAVSLDVVPVMLAGHREIASIPVDETAEARIFWCQAQTRLLSAVETTSEEESRRRLTRDVSQLRRYAKHVGLP